MRFERQKLGGYGIFVGVLAIYRILYRYSISAVTGLGKPMIPMYIKGGWFHYAKLYAKAFGCTGLRSGSTMWIGKTNWFKVWPFVIVAINIMIAVASDFESAIKGAQAVNGWWYSIEDVWLNGGWWNWVNGIAGILNIFCMTGWWGIYASKDKNHQDMLWPDMTVWFIVAYDLWNFTYTYNNLPTHSWYCGLALLLAPTFANALWNKGGWIQNRANTLATWCMFAQVVPMFQIKGRFSVLPVLYSNVEGFESLDAFSLTTMDLTSVAPNTKVQGFMAIIALVANVICLSVIIKRAIEQKKNPYKNEIFADTKDFKVAIARAEK